MNVLRISGEMMKITFAIRAVLIVKSALILINARYVIKDFNWIQMDYVQRRLIRKKVFSINKLIYHLSSRINDIF